MGSSTPREAPEPRALTIKGFKFNGVDRYVPGCRYTEIAEAEGFGESGLYFMPPGAQTTVFSLESGDDGTAESVLSIIPRQARTPSGHGAGQHVA